MEGKRRGKIESFVFRRENILLEGETQGGLIIIIVISTLKLTGSGVQSVT